MEITAFHFRLKPAAEDLLPQISAALEKRTELLSRSQYPKMWQVTDKLNSRSSAPNKTRHMTLGILFLLFGIFLLILGIVAPKTLLFPLIAGILAIINGVTHLLRARTPGPSAFDKAAQQLLEKRAQAEEHKYTCLFSTEGMVIASKEEGEDPQLIPCDRINAVFETQELYLLIYDESVIVLQKQELAESPEDFRAFLSKKVQWVSLID